MKWPRLSRRWLFVPPIVVGMVIVGLLAFLESRRGPKRLPEREQARPLAIIRARAHSVAPRAMGYGTAKPARVWIAVAEVGGRIQQRHEHLRSGVHVEAGELLIRVDDVDYKLRQSQRQADLEKAQAQLQQLALSEQSDKHSLAIQEELLSVRKSELDRIDMLQGTSAASQSEEDAAHASWLQQKQAVQTLRNTLSLYASQIAAADAEVDLAKARLAEAQRDLTRTRIVAPFDGSLSEVNLEQDQYVATGERMFQLHDVQAIEVEAQFSLAQLSRLLSPTASSRESNQLGSPEYYSTLVAEVITHSGDHTDHYSGKPIRIRETIDEQTRTVGIVIRVDNQKQDGGMPLRPGTYCEVVLTSNVMIRAITVPATAVDNDQVFIVDDQSRLRKRPVQTGFAVGRSITIVDGIQEGERVVARPVAALVPNQLVAPEIDSSAERDLVSSRGSTETR